jgi:hypothetical protein
MPELDISAAFISEGTRYYRYCPGQTAPQLPPLRPG